MPFSSIHWPEPPPAGIWQLHQVGPLGPFSFSSVCDGMCLKNAPSCGTSSQSGRRTPSLLGHLCHASVYTTKAAWLKTNRWYINRTESFKALQFSSAQLCRSHLHSCSSSCSSLARSNKPPPAMDMVDLLCGDPGPRLVIWGNSNSILPAWGVGACCYIQYTYRQLQLLSSKVRVYLDHPQLCCHLQSIHLPKPSQGGTQTLQGYGSSRHSVQQPNF